MFAYNLWARDHRCPWEDAERVLIEEMAKVIFEAIKMKTQLDVSPQTHQTFWPSRDEQRECPCEDLLLGRARHAQAQSHGHCTILLTQFPELRRLKTDGTSEVVCSAAVQLKPLASHNTGQDSTSHRMVPVVPPISNDEQIITSSETGADSNTSDFVDVPSAKIDRKSTGQRIRPRGESANVSSCKRSHADNDADNDTNIDKGESRGGSRKSRRLNPDEANRSTNVLAAAPLTSRRRTGTKRKPRKGVENTSASSALAGSRGTSPHADDSAHGAAVTIVPPQEKCDNTPGNAFNDTVDLVSVINLATAKASREAWRKESREDDNDLGDSVVDMKEAASTRTRPKTKARTQSAPLGASPGRDELGE